MAQIFPPGINTFARVGLAGGLAGSLLFLGVLMELDRTPYVTRQDVERQQPVPFSHKHHAGDDGIDCRYCHTSVEVSAFAGIPPTQTCMNCHSMLYGSSAMLEPVRESYRTGRPILWTRVNDLPDYVYFNHSIHIHKGVGCSTCHGRVDRMPLLRQEASLKMEWCLECHREPEKYVRPRSQIFNMAWEPPRDQIAQGMRLMREYGIRNVHEITDCYTCHR